VVEESDSPKKPWTMLIGSVVAGLVSLAVGVGSGITVNWFTAREPGLEYALVTCDQFAGDQFAGDQFAGDQFAGKSLYLEIVTLNISNPANKEVENVTSSLNLHSLIINKIKVVGLVPGSYTPPLTKEGSVIITVPYLNPKESYSVELLLTSQTPSIPKLDVVVRGKGITGLPRAAGGNNSDNNLLSVVVSSAASILAVSMLFLTLYLRRTP